MPPTNTIKQKAMQDVVSATLCNKRRIVIRLSQLSVLFALPKCRLRADHRARLTHLAPSKFPTAGCSLQEAALGMGLGLAGRGHLAH